MPFRAVAASCVLAGAALLLSACPPTPANSPMHSSEPARPRTSAEPSLSSPSPSNSAAAQDFYVSPGAVHTSIVKLRADGRDADAELPERTIANQSPRRVAGRYSDA